MIDQNTYVTARQLIAAGNIVFANADAVITTSGGVSVARVKELMQSQDARTAQYADELYDAVKARLKNADAFTRYEGLPGEAQPGIILRQGVAGLTKEMPVEYGGVKGLDGGMVISKAADLVTRIDLVKEIAAKGELHKYLVPRVITTGQVDRANDRVKTSGIRFDNYLKNPVVLYAHDHKAIVGNAVGDIRRGTNSVVIDHQYHGMDGQNGIPKLAAMMAMAGVLTADSIGFIPLSWDDTEKVTQAMVEQYQAYPFTTHIRTYTVSEMLEDSLVAVPMNPGATSGKSWEKHLDACIERGMFTGDDVAQLLNSTNTNTTIKVKTMPEIATAAAETKAVETATAADIVTVKHLVLEKDAQAVVDKGLLGEDVEAYSYMSVLYDLMWRMYSACGDAVMHGKLDLLPEIFAEFAAVATRMASAILEPDEAMMQELSAQQKEMSEVRAGQVLSRKNKENLIKAVAAARESASAIQEVLDSAAQEESATGGEVKEVAPVETGTATQQLGDYVSRKQYERDQKEIVRLLHATKSAAEAGQKVDAVVARVIGRIQTKTPAKTADALVGDIVERIKTSST